ncbi:ABC transporter permease [Paractinoplanes atraurantiacus]|uniref:Peptide/nickel transport system permease protein n=1 Tax=Paractinoplanes atraurantiacus TaxID=1036182 RepID=A0A285IRA5_9ACTN|nr:ABC transporter permease [Actinoplanes atraurantiacus]SNY50237.1 peptide/nickel transport system permease protein [Actinoplanes atraurantiacus]
MEPLIEEAELSRTPASTDPMTAAAGDHEKKVTTRRKSPTQIALARLRKDKVAVICASIFIFFVLIAIFAPLLAKLEGQSPTEYHQDLIDQYGYPTIAPNSEHWFGVEPRLGRDLFARFVYGARPSLIVAGSVTIITTVIGVVVGLLAGFVGGWLDRIISWVIDFVLSLPYLLFAIAVPAVLLSVFVGTSEDVAADDVASARFYSLIIVLSFFGWASLARLIRGEVLSLREREFVSAAKVLGVPTHKILFKELLPNLVAPIVISVSMALPTYIVTEAGLTYLGVGLTEPTPSWGLTIAAAQNFYRVDPLYLWIPVAAITILVLALSLLGDSIRDAFDPRTRR